MFLRIALLALLGSTQGFVMQPMGAVAMRSSAVSTESPVMLFGGKKPAAKKAAKKAVKKAARKALKKPGKTVAKTFAGETAFGKGPLGTAQSFFSEENWAVQAFKALAALPSSKPRQSDEGRA